MASEQTTTAVIGAITTVLPSVIGLIKDLVGKQTPGVPPPTDAEVKALLVSAIASSLAVDDRWLSQHPSS